MWYVNQDSSTSSVLVGKSFILTMWYVNSQIMLETGGTVSPFYINYVVCK